MMKKILVLLAFFIPTNIYAEVEEMVTLNGVIEPEWKDFAPSSFVDVSEPKGLGKLNETAIYWYNRRLEFEEEMNKCHDLEEDDMIYSCIQEVKIKQYQKNSEYNAKIEAQERANMLPTEMQDRTNNMIPIGGYLNNFARFQPNEIRGY